MLFGNLSRPGDGSGDNNNVSQFWEAQIAEDIHLIYVPICTTIGILGNVVSFFVLVLSSLKSTTSCLYMAVIACLDTTILCLDLSFFVDKFTDQEIFHEWSCGFVMFLFYFVIHFDVMLLTAMTFERYLAVTYPLHAHTMITMKRTKCVICGTGLFSFALNLFNVFILGMVEVKPGVFHCTPDGEDNIFFVDKVYRWIDSTLYCFVPVISLFTLNILIIRNLRKATAVHNKMISNNNISLSTSRRSLALISSRNLSTSNSLSTSKSSLASSHESSGKKNHQESRNQHQVTLMLVLISFAFLILAAPVAVYRLVEKFLWIADTDRDRARKLLAHAIIDNLMYTNHAVNFILYMLSGQKFRTEFKRLVCKCLRQDSNRVLQKRANTDADAALRYHSADESNTTSTTTVTECDISVAVNNSLNE